MKNLCKIRDIQRAVIAFEIQFEERYGICFNEGMALCSLYKENCLNSGELGEMLGLSSSNVSKVIRSIEKKGFVKRLVGKEDRRQMCFSLTNKGMKLISTIDCQKKDMPKLLQDLIK